MIRRLFLSLFAFALLGLSLTASAQSDPLPVPADATAPTGPVERTAADLEAIRQLDEAGMRAARSMTPRAISHFVIPQTIRVGIVFDYTNDQTFNATWENRHCSTWLANGQPVYEVRELDFRQYVKDVLPNEWGATWPVESLRAGGVAAKMFAWWRINITEQYPGTFRPVGLHVVNNTCDQFYLPGQANAQTDAAVDYTWPYRLHENEIVKEIHYLATADQCANAQASYGWPRCLPQWETYYMGLEGATWYDMIYQYYSPISISVTDDIAVNTNVLKNPNFNTDTTYWTVSGTAQGTAVNGGVFNFYRNASGSALIRQEVGVLISPNSQLQMQVMMGNSSAVPKQVTARIMRGDGGATAASCTFTLDPNTPPQKHIIWGVTPAAWSGVRVQITAESADDTPAYLVDKVKLFYKPGSVPAESCVAPPPGKPQIVAPVASTMYENDLTVLLTEGKSNYRTGYDAAFHIQIDNNSDFSSPYFDNSGDLADEPALSLYLPGRTWHIRARQFDGIDRYSAWTAGVAFMTDPLPDKPVLSGPSGDVPADGQSFGWTAGLQTDKYQLIVKNNAGKLLAKVNLVLPSASCDAAVCSVPLASVPVNWKPNKTYVWFVKAINAAGKVKSAKTSFRLIAAP